MCGSMADIQSVTSQNDWGSFDILIVGTRFIEYISSRINVICSYSETWTWQVVRCFPLDQIPLIRSRSMALLVHFPSTELPCPVSLPQRTAATATNRTYTTMIILQGIYCSTAKTRHTASTSCTGFNCAAINVYKHSLTFRVRRYVVIATN